jgi:hypothetical protein
MSHEPQYARKKQADNGGGHDARTLHPAWREFIRFCQELRFGEIDRLSIQDGLPLMAETTKKKTRFT